MKSITEQLDERFGVGSWRKLSPDERVGNGDITGDYGGEELLKLYAGPGDKLLARDLSHDGVYRAKPKPSGKFWALLVSGEEVNNCETFTSKEDATIAAGKAALFDKKCFVMESVGYAYAVKTIDYEEL